MNTINVKNGLMIDKIENYSMYEMYTEDAEKYYMCLPTSEESEYQMVIDFPEEYFKSLLNEEITAELKRICDSLFQKKRNALYVLPNISTYDVSIYKEENDDHAYQNLFKNLQRYTRSAYNALSGNINISNVIAIVTQTNDDRKLMDWLDIVMPGYFENIDLSALIADKIATDDTGWTSYGSMSNGGNTLSESNTKSKPKVRVLVPNKHGFLNITFTIVIIVLSLIIGLVVAIMIMR